MKLRSIFLERLPGIDERLPIKDLGDGINLVIGPNGSGKTSLCRAVLEILWPTRGKSAPDHYLESLWQDESNELCAEYDHKSVVWRQRDGRDGTAPPLPDEHLKHCYVLGQKDLLQSESATDDVVASDIRRQMSGGYDVDGVRASLQKPLGKTYGKTERDAVKKASDSLRALRQDRKSLATQQNSLGEIHRKRDLAQAAANLLPRLTSAMELAETRETLSQRTAELAAFPGGREAMDKLEPTSAERLEELETALDTANRQAKEAEQERIEANRTIAQEELPERPIEEETLRAWPERARNLGELEREVRNAETEVNGAKDRLASARNSLGATSPSKTEIDIDPATLDAVDDFIDQAGKLRSRRNDLEAELTRLSGAEDDEDIAQKAESLRKARDILNNWLAAPQALDRNIIGKTPMLVLGAACLAIGVATILNTALLPWFTAIASTCIVLGWLTLGPGHQAPSDKRTIYQEEWADLGRENIRWSREEVRETLWKTDGLLAEVLARKEDQRRRADLEANLRTTEGRETELDSTRSALREQLGIDPASSDLRLAAMAERLSALRAVTSELSGAESKHELLQKRSANLLSSINTFLQAHGSHSCQDAASASTAIEALKDRNTKLLGAMGNRDRAEKDIDMHGEAQKLATKKISGFYEAVGVGDGDRSTLNQRLSQLTNYARTKKDHDELLIQLRGVEKKLGAQPELLTLSAEDARNKFSAAQDKAGTLQAIDQQIGEIGKAVKIATASHELETAAAELATARDALKQRLDEQIEARAATLLLDTVEEEFEHESRPEVVKRAQELFSAFTDNRYELKFDTTRDGRQTSSFRAIDTSTMKGFALSELSDGTRVQLLLATRLAFAMKEEKGTQLPFFLDETLCTADPIRFDAVARSLLKLDRQIFYLSADPNDVEKWRNSCAPYGAEPTLTDLGRLRSGEASITDTTTIAPPPPTHVPQPTGSNPEEYALKLGVAKLDPWQPVESLDLFYLMRDDLETIYHLRHRARIETVGQWRSLESAGRTHVLDDEVDATRIAALADLAQATFAAWRTGRGKPVVRETLKESGAISDKYLEAIVAIAQKSGGDSQVLLDVIARREDERAKGFRKIEDLRGYLAEQGYIDPRPLLDESARLTMVLAAVEEHVSKRTLEKDAITSLAEQLWALMDSAAS